MKIQIPSAFRPLFKPYRYKAFYGGRGSAKSHSFASALVLLASQKPLRILCGREIQRSIKDSVKRLIDDKIREYGLSSFFTSTETEIRGINGSLFLFAGIKTNPESIKSMEGIDICWVEEASTISRRSLDFLIPTIRKENSEIWFSWNPESELDPVDIMFRGGNPPPNSLIKKVSWQDNPFFSDVLKDEMEFDRATNPSKYNHIWEGGYAIEVEGAYYAEKIQKAIIDNRVTHVPHDSNSGVVLSFDLGISDMTSVWVCQNIGFQARIIDCFESNGQPIVHYIQEARNRGYMIDSVILPHDGQARQLGTGKSIEEILRGLGLKVIIAPRLSVKDGIDAVRVFLDKCWFDEIKTKDGLKALRSYRENYNHKLKISLGPLHDHSSHFADSFRYLALALPSAENKSKVQEAIKKFYSPSNYHQFESKL